MLIRFDFSEKSRSWMRTCVFVGNLVVLVNGCPTQEIIIKRGLKQEDHLAFFPFLLVVEGLSGLVTKAKEIGLYCGFRMGTFRLVVSYLQYADDTLLVVDPTMENLFSIKAIFRGFEWALKLRVNFFKSSLIGVNVDFSFLSSAGNFLHCEIDSFPFKYLGLLVGDKILD